jgi:outer membrane receptor protein involved in Fe transport
VDLYASARDTFKPAAIDFGVDADPEILDPETATSYELGAKWAVGRGSASLSFFRMDMQNLVVSQVVDGLPSLENAGETRFQGIEARGAWRWTGALHLTAAYSLQDARFRDYLTEFDGVPTQLAGKRVEMTARDMASAGLVYAPKVGWHGSTVVQWVGARWLNKRNTALARDYVTWSAGVGYHFHTVDLRVDGWNLNDQRPPVAESEVGDAQYYRLPARSAAVSLTWVR